VNNETKKIEATLASEDVAHEDGVKVKADNGMTVALDKDAAGKLGETMKEKGIDHIVMNISLEPDLSTLTPEAAAAVEEAKKNGAVVFDFSFINTDKNEKVEFDTASAGAIVVELPLTAEQKEAFSKYDKAVVVSVGSDGSIEYMPTWYNAETGVLTFTAKRPASYMAMKDDRKSGPELKPEMIGDLDGDGKAIATDAAMLLKLYAELSSGGRDATATELYLCDVNRNGKIEAGDAAFVLKYYAEASGGYDKTIDVYLKEVLNIAI